MKKISLFLFLLVIFGFLGYLGKGALDYRDWLKTKDVVAASSLQQYAGTFGAITPACTYTQSGCTCALCNDCGCNNFNQAMITMGQEVNKGAINLCVGNEVQVKGTPLLTASGRQFIAGSLLPKCLTGNAILATPTMAASDFERLARKVGDFYLAGKKIFQ